MIDAGMVIPLEDLIKENTPRLYAHYKPFWNQIKNPDDGHIYFIPDYGRIYRKFIGIRSMGPAFYIQRGVLKEFGYPVIKTLDDYFDVIRKYKEKYPEIDGKPTIGFEILSYSWRSFCLKNPPQHLIGHPNDGNVVVDPETHHAEIYADKDYAKRYFKKLNEMFLLGLVEKETFVRTYDQYLAVISSGRVLGMFDQYWNFQQADNALETQGNIERTYVPTVPTFDGITDYYFDRPPININRGFAVTTACKDPLKFLKLLDTLLDEKWQKILSWGIEGEDYLVDENGRFYLTQEMRDRSIDSSWRAANQARYFYAYAPKIEGLFSDGNAWTPGDQPEEFFNGLKPEEKEYLNAYGYKTYVDVFNPAPPNRIDYPAWTITLEDGSAAQIAWNKIDEIVVKWLPRVITADAGKFDAIWNEYIAELHKQDIKAYEDAINKAIQYRLENWGPGK
jgi:putative aldouronate transport system substrate-binding protein